MNNSEWGPNWGRIDTSSLRGYSTTPEIESYQRQFIESGIMPPEPEKKKVGTLQKILGILQRGETAPAVMAAIKGGDALSSWLESTFGPEPEQRITYSDVFTELGWNPTDPVEKGAKFAAGLVLDVLLDPKTYLTLGGGGIAKITTKVGGETISIALSKKGSKFVEKSAKEFGKDLSKKLAEKGIEFTPFEIANAAHKHAIRELGAKISSGEGAKFLAKDGLKFMGQQILPKDLVEAPIKGVERLIEKVPVINKLYEGTRKAFEPFYEIKKLPTPMSSKVENMFTFYPKAIRAEQRQVLEDITSISQKISKIDKKDLNKIIEGASVNRAKQIFDKYIKNLNKSYEKEAVRNISDDLIEQVRYINPRAANYIKKINLKNVSSFDDYFDKILKVLPKELQTKELVDNGIKPLLQKNKNIIFPQMVEERQKQLIKSGIIDNYQKKIAEQLSNRPIKEVMSELYEKGIKTGYKEVDDVLELVGQRMSKIWSEEAERGIIEKKLASPYLRHTLTPEAKKAISEGKDIFEGMAKPLRIRLGASKPRQIMKTIKEANEWSTKNLGYKLFEEDIFKAWGVREFEHIAAVRTYDFLDNLGKTFGEVYEPVKKTVKTTSGKLVKRDVYPEKVIDGLKYITSKSPQLEGIYFPEAIAKKIDDVYGTLTNEETLKSFIKAYDKALNFWKGTVTGIWPSFHTRNFIGGSFNNFIEDGLLPGKWAKTTEKILKGQEGEFVTKTGNKLKYKDILKNYLYRGGSQPGTIDVVREMDDLLNAGKISKKIKNAPVMAMEAVENRLRMPLFLNRLWKGDSYDDAMKAVYRSHFDYAPEALTAFERNVMKRVIPFYCVPISHEILTKNGWKYFNELKNGEEVLTYNHKTGDLEWQELEDIAVFDFNGMLKKIERRGGKVLFTEDHRWPVVESKRFVKGKWYGGKSKIKRTFELNTSDLIPLTGNYNQKESILTPREAAILGWVVGDGYSRWRKNSCEMVVYQSPKKYLKTVIKLLGTKPRKPHPQTGVVCVPVKKEDVKKITKFYKDKSSLKEIVGRLSKEAAYAMREALFLAEGFIDENTLGFVQDPQKNKEVLDCFQILTLLIGKSGNITSRGLYVQISKYLHIKEGIGEEYYNGKIWCPKTKNGTWVMRNNGFMMITGNTWVRNNVPYQLGQLIKQPGKYAALAKTQRDFNNLTPEAQEEMSYMPNWMSEMFLLRLPLNEQRLYLQLDLPIEDLAKLPLTEDGVREIFSLMSPVLKYPIEMIANRNIYFGSEIYDKDLPPEFRTSPTLQGLSKLPEPIKNWLNFNEGVKKNYMTGEYEPYFEMDSVKLYTIRTFLGRFYSSFDQALQEDMPLWGKLSRLVGGVPVRELNLEEEKYRKEKEYQRLLQELSTYYKQRQMMPYASEQGSFNIPMQ